MWLDTLGIIAPTGFLNFRDNCKACTNNKVSMNQHLYWNVMKINISYPQKSDILDIETQSVQSSETTPTTMTSGFFLLVSIKIKTRVTLGRPGLLRFMGSQRVGQDWATDLIWSDIGALFGYKTVFTIINILPQLG